MRRSQDYLDGYADGMEIGYRVGYTVAKRGRVPDEVRDLARPPLRLVHSQPAACCTRSRRPRPHLAVVS